MSPAKVHCRLLRYLLYLIQDMGLVVLVTIYSVVESNLLATVYWTHKNLGSLFLGIAKLAFVDVLLSFQFPCGIP